MTTQIEWAANPDGTPGLVWNPVTGCTKVHAGCTHCYAKRIHDMRHKAHLAGKKVAECYHTPFEKVMTWDNRLTAPLHWRGERTCFLDSMGDPFHEDIPFTFIDKVMAVVALTPRVRYIALTKRIDIALKYLTDPETPRRIAEAVHMVYLENDIKRLHHDDPRTFIGTDSHIVQLPLPNLILGTSPCNQKTAEETIPILLQCPAALRCISLEPLLGPIDLDAYTCGECGKAFTANQSMKATKATKAKCPYCEHCDEHAGSIHTHWLRRSLSARAPENATRYTLDAIPGLDWIITGGESGPKARPSHPDWFRRLRDQCTRASVPFFFKQWGEWREFDYVPGQTVEVENDTLEADVLYESAIRPGFITLDGRFITNRNGLPEETPCRMMERVGKTRAGRQIDGREWNQRPPIFAPNTTTGSQVALGNPLVPEATLRNPSERPAQ